MEIELFVVPYDSARPGERMGAGPNAAFHVIDAVFNVSLSG